MCLAVPGMLTAVDNGTGQVEINGLARSVSLLPLEDAAVGDYVIVHAGFAISRLSKSEAEETLEILKEMR
jgi:hydrogenase expression/formation protein HypC